MTSMITNTSAMVALQTLRSINTSLDTTNNHVSTGKRINSASDGAAYWSIATTLTSDNGALGAVKNAMSLDKNSVDAASGGVNAIISTLGNIKNDLTAALSPNVDRTKLQTEIASFISQIKTTSDNSVMNGSNWLSVDTSASGFNGTKNLLSSFSRTGSTVTVGSTAIDTGAFAIYDAATAGTSSGTASTTDVAVTAVATAASVSGGATVSVDTAAGSLKGFMDTKYVIGGTATSGTEAIKDFDVSALGNTDADLAKIQAYVKIVDATMQQLQNGATTLGTTSTRLTSQQTFAQSLIDLNTSSIGSLVDANMEEESTKLKALQTQQQLAVQSLSIANNSTQNVMTLFR
ncbi:flagellin N-terminal helical domain-containing protein [Roseixanthobacter glucoisosaccharinicivorans]|uniref:flagellin N-terminal helical domain-containing protein n=1 Tax=Roseixanthobacter glucoisosaccharinicivorans TaxID=3119923 RepID=UPI0037274157